MAFSLSLYFCVGKGTKKIGDIQIFELEFLQYPLFSIIVRHGVRR